MNQLNREIVIKIKLVHNRNYQKIFTSFYKNLLLSLIESDKSIGFITKIQCDDIIIYSKD